jgi:copper chaperone CopZ
MQKRTVTVPNITCGHCTATITRELTELEGVVSVDANGDSQTVVVQWEPPMTWEVIAETLEEIGYPAV